jgi:hypothetical protein
MSYFRLYVFGDNTRAIQSFDLIAPEYAQAIARSRHELNHTANAVGYELWQSTPRRPGDRQRKWLLACKEVRDETRKFA